MKLIAVDFHKKARPEGKTYTMSHMEPRTPTHIDRGLIAGIQGKRIFFMINGQITEEIGIGNDVFTAEIKFPKDLKSLTED